VHQDFGPAMLALTEPQRRFVLALFETNPGRGALQRAAIRAGYGGGKSSIRSINSMAHELWRSEKVRAAYAEQGHKYIGHASVAALKAVHELVLDASHPDHLKACRIFIDRTWPTETHQKIDVTHHKKVDDTEAWGIALRLSQETGIPIEKLMGASNPRLAEMKQIQNAQPEPKANGSHVVLDAVAVEVKPEPASETERPREIHK
jgi:phage terminase small subunit